MIQIGIPELLIIILVFFVAAKPEKISKYLRYLMKSFKEDLEREFNYQELKQEVFNEKKMKEFDKEDE